MSLLSGTKAWLKRHWPPIRLRAILFGVLLFVAALPGVAAVFLRVYENTLVQQTKAELIAQGAALGGAYRAAWGARAEALSNAGERPRVDLSAMPVLPVAPAPVRALPAEPPARAAGAAVAGVVGDTSRVTLAAIRLLDAHGTVVFGVKDTGLSYAALPEVRAAMAGRRSTVLRRRGGYRPRYSFEWLSRASAIRVHHARPVVARGRVIGVVMLSRSPRGLFVGVYQDRGKIAFGIAAIFATLLLLAGLLSRAIARPIEALGRATEQVARGAVTVPEPPATAAVEIRELYENFAAMAERIERRGNYLRDFAAALSHEFKTPITGLRGALELLGEHPDMGQAERARFLANARADADRLERLVRRLLELARADMTPAPETARTDLAAPIRRVADAHRSTRLEVVVALPAYLPPVAAPAALIEAVLETLIENSAQAGASRVTIAAEGGDPVCLTMADNGRGIAPADLARVFEPFHTGRRAEGGTGLGLAIARSLLAACGGEICAHDVERGAMIVVTLPVAVE